MHRIDCVKIQIQIGCAMNQDQIGSANQMKIQCENQRTRDDRRNRSLPLGERRLAREKEVNKGQSCRSKQAELKFKKQKGVCCEIRADLGMFPQEVES